MKEQYITIGFTWSVIFFFFLLWGQSGWYRIDCALSVNQACELISKEYEKKKLP